MVPDWTIEVSPEVEDWYLALRTKGLAQADRALDRLREVGPLLPMPHSRQLGEGLQELRFTCQDHAQPLTYYVDSERRIITLTTFVKQRQNERREVQRARRAMQARKEKD